jgi:MFS family permease
MGVACIWCGIGSTHSYGLLVAGRACLGAFEAPIESIVPSTVTDIFFLHERGAKVSYYGLSVLGGNELGPMFSAIIIEHLNMKWAFFIVGIFVFAAEIPMFFFMPETRFLGARPDVNNLDSIENEKGSYSYVEDKNVQATEHNLSGEAVQRLTYIDSLRPWGTNDPSVSLRKTFLRPFVLLAYPTVLWSCIVYGVCLTWNVVIGSTLAQLMAPP